jgi:hypothetical protein
MKSSNQPNKPGFIINNALILTQKCILINRMAAQMPQSAVAAFISFQAAAVLIFSHGRGSFGLASAIEGKLFVARQLFIIHKLIIAK